MNPLSKIGVLAIAALLAFGAGFYTEHRFVQASQVAVVQKEIKGTAVAIKQSVAASQQVEATAATKAAAVQSVETAVNARLDQPRKTTHTTNHDAPQATADCETATAGDQPLPFDIDTVRLLNAARQGIAVGAAPSSDAKVATPASAAGGSPDHGEGVHGQ